MDIDSSLTYEASLMTPQITITPSIDRTQPLSQSDDTWNSIPTISNDGTDNEQYSNESLTKITNDLKRSCVPSTRKPTQSPFFSSKTFVNNGLLSKTSVTESFTCENNCGNAPSTADVLNDIDSLEQKLPDVKSETILANPDFLLPENIQNEGMSTSVSPKKRLIIRSQSQTDAMSSNIATINGLNQSQKTTMEVKSFTNGYLNGTSNMELNFAPVTDRIIKPDIDFTLENNTGIIQSYPLNNRPESNYVHSTMTKTQTASHKMKRPVESTTNGNQLFKSDGSLMSNVITATNEVTSSSHSSNKRLKTMVNSNRTVNHRQDDDFKLGRNNDSSSISSICSNSDDQKRQQIRDSNREAARRCRERRRQHIEHLESDLDKLKQELQTVTEKLSKAEHEKIQLQAIIHETGILPSRRIGNEIVLDFPMGVNTANLIDSNGLQRNFIYRNHH